MNKKAGVLLHITSLPGKYGIGTLGAEAYSFVDFLAEAGFSAWQILPVNPVGAGYSPYQSPNSLEGNPMLIDPDLLFEKGLISENELPPISDTDEVDFPAIEAEWDKMLALCVSRSDDENFIQNEWRRQWDALHTYANSRGVEIIGDLPIYVAPGSVDFTSQPEQFARGLVAGCPPDAFSATGQLWGNPIYDWDAMANDGYRFWINRIRHTLSLFDRVRLDHFRGFCAYWAIPEDAEEASEGEWKQGPGLALFDALFREFGHLPLIAEDLGYITDDVHALRNALDMPGMAILQFAFDSDDCPYHPEKLHDSMVCYTGTHDNDTTLGWAQSGGFAVEKAMEYFKAETPLQLVGAMIFCALSSPAELAIIPMQDLLREGSQYRMNIPGTATGNWRYRLDKSKISSDLAKKYRALLSQTDRL